MSHKTQLTGHKIRHIISNQISNIDLYGNGTNKPVKYKEESLIDYRFSIVVENTKTKNFFTEKLIDSFAVGTIPIYWGCNNIDEFFDKDGLITFNTVDELKSIIPTLDKDKYDSMVTYTKNNLQLAKKYLVMDDWIYDNIISKL